jgi:class 3 adenylate cyclase
VVLSDATVAALSQVPPLVELGPQAVKGRVAPVPAFMIDATGGA